MRPQKWRYASQFDTTMIASKGRPKSNPGTKAVIFITGHNGILTASKFLRSEQLLRILINVSYCICGELLQKAGHVFDDVNVVGSILTRPLRSFAPPIEINQLCSKVFAIQEIVCDIFLVFQTSRAYSFAKC